jgi:hypothetical protein
MMQLYRGLCAALGWFAIVTQYWLNTSQLGFIEGSILYFGFFSLLGNILVACAFTAPFLPGAQAARFFMRPGVRTAIAVYILVIAVIFYLLLRKLYQPTGLGGVLNDLMHYVMPALYLLDWAFFLEKQRLSFRQIPAWLVFPLAYAGVTLLHGAYSGYYPYPFLDAGKYGYRQISINIALLSGFFIVLSLAFVGAAKLAVALDIDVDPPTARRMTGTD